MTFCQRNIVPLMPSSSSTLDITGSGAGDWMGTLERWLQEEANVDAVVSACRVDFEDAERARAYVVERVRKHMATLMASTGAGVILD